MKRKYFVRQKDSMQCGVACLAMVCRHFGMDISTGFLSRFCHATTQGVTMLGLKEAAKTIGLDSVSAKITVSKLEECPLPAILHWNQNHYVVLHRISRKGMKFHIADPGVGMLAVNRKDFLEHWTGNADNGQQQGIAMFLEPDESFGKIQDDTVSERRSFKFLFRYLKQYRRHFLQIAAGMALGCLLQLVMPFLTQSIVDTGIRNSDIGFIWLILIGELMVVAGQTATDFIRRWLLLHISMRVNISLLSDFFIKLLKLPMSFFDTKLTGDLLQRMSDHDRTQNFLTGQVLGIVFSLLSFLIFGVVLFIYDRLVFGVFMAGTAVYALWTMSFLRRRKTLDYELFGKQAKNQNQTWQFITSMQEIKLQGCGKRRRWEWEDTQAELFEVRIKSLKMQQAQEAGSIFINEIKNILITVFSATAVIKGDITLGGMMAIQYMVGQLNSPVSQLISFIYSLQDVNISLERINEIHEGRNEECQVNRKRNFPSGRDISLETVDFKYDPHSLKNTLSGVSFKIPEGKVTAIVGASGSGKSTLVKLMLGYYPVADGQIAVSGMPIEEYDIDWWRSQCGVVMQDGVIFSESIRRNIAVGDCEVDEERLEYAARLACIHDYVMTLPLRYDTKVGRDGVGLSQGQKQRILIARAVYKDPAFIFLDEATNSLDANNERTIVENLDRFFKGRTVVIVAHRLSTVRNADNIVVLDKGSVVESGTHESLTESKGAYYSLVKNQLELGT